MCTSHNHETHSLAESSTIVILPLNHANNADVCMCVCIYVCLYACMYVYMYVCLHVYTYMCKLEMGQVDGIVNEHYISPTHMHYIHIYLLPINYALFLCMILS